MRSFVPYFSVFSLISAACLLPYACAQDITGTIVGTVTDSSGAVVPNAAVSLFSIDRNRSERTFVTGSTGNFSASLLPIGKYNLSVEAKGFKKASIAGVVLNVNDKLTFPIKLEVGEVTQVIDVQESPVVVQLQSAEQSTTITGTQIRELTLNNRNYEQLLTLMPGVSSTASDQIYVGVSNPNSGQSNQVNFSINGSRPTENAWTVDGADNVDRGANLTLLNYPSVDAIQEFKVLRSDYSAELGRAGGAQISVVTKSGTSVFHGDAYEFARNNSFSANSYTNKAGYLTGGAVIKTPPLRYNDFGWTLGGPIFIPGLYNKDRNKTFFFVSEEFRRVITYTSAAATLPTAQMEQGIFAHPVCIAYTALGACAQSGTRVTNIDPTAQAYLTDIFARVPVGAPGSFTNVTPLRNVYNFEQELYKLDHIFSPKLQVSVRYLRDAIPTTEPQGLFTGDPIPNVATTNTNSPGHSWVGRATSTLSPTLVNEAGFAYSYGAVISNPVGYINQAQSPDIKPNLPFTDTLGRVPSITLTGGTGLAGYGPYRDFNRDYNAYDNMTAILGRHNLRYGFTYNWYQKTENAATGNAGSFSFAPSSSVIPTGGANIFEQSFADFLSGHVSTFTQASQDITPDIRAQQWEVYLQDDWRIKPNFTWNWGIRYSMFRNPTDDRGELTTFDPSRYNPAVAPSISASGNIVAGTGTALNGIILGGQNSPYGSKVSSQPLLDFAPRLGFAWDPFKTGKTSVRGGYGIFYDSTAYGYYELNIFQNPPYVNSVSIPNTSLNNPLSGTPSVSAAPKVLRATSPLYQTPYTQQWSFSIQRQITNSFLLDVAYVGSKSTHLLGLVDLDEVSPGLAYSSGLFAAGAPITRALSPQLNQLRPYKGYSAINEEERWFNANYNALQVFGEKRFTGDFLVSFSYTYSKNITDASTDSTAPQNRYNFNEGERGLSQYNRTHIFSANYVYELPFLRSQKGLIGKALGGWEISGIVQADSGTPATVTTSNSLDPAGLGFLGSSAAGARPDETCNPNSGAPHTLLQWFNTGCFANVPAGTVIRPGNAGRGVVTNPGFQRWDVSAIKNITFHERFRLQLRGDAFNVFNHASPSTVNTTLGSSVYGQVTGFHDPRILQVAAKVYF